MGDRERVLVVGGTGRTGVKLVDKLRTDPSLTVCVLARDREKADMLFASDDEVEIIEGDLTNTAEWEDSLDGVSQVVTAVSCGLRTDPLVVLGLREAPGRLPHEVDHDGIASLAAAASRHGVKRLVAVTTASAGTPWSPAAMFLNAACYGSVKWKFEGEQA
mmetsp:Transcript_572/g.1192  ORF Transcript_572/g.1192 Transcript_572/m.1192 type:complete len:161 (-) Transcript_572:695-1177(-)